MELSRISPVPIAPLVTAYRPNAADPLVPTYCSGSAIPEKIALMADTAELRIQGRLRVVEMTGSWGAYAGERIIVGPGESFRDDLGIKIREAFEDGAADALSEGRSPSEHFELPHVRITIEVVPPAADA
jgi:hypothetical protein